MTSYHKIPGCLLEYAGASLVLHAGCLALLLLRLTYFNQHTAPKKPDVRTPQPSQSPPRVTLKRVPATPTPIIKHEQEATHSVPPVSAAAACPAMPPQRVMPTITQNTHTPERIQPAQPQETKSEQPAAQERHAADTPAQRTFAAPTKHTVKRTKMQHSWYKHDKKSSYEPRVTTQVQHSSLTHESLLEHMIQRSPYKKLTEAERAVEKFKSEFQEAGVSDYVSAIHHAIAFSLNRMRITLAAHDIPAHIIMQVTINADGSLANTHVQIPNYHNASLTDKIRQAVIQAAPFRPFPSSITSPDITLTIDAYPDSSCFKGQRYSTRATPLIFTLHNNRQRF